MGEGLWMKLAEQAPYLAIMLALVYMFQLNENKREERRISHEKEMESRREAFDREVNNMLANSIKSVSEQQKEMQQALVGVLNAHETASKERYERMGITKDLLNAATEREHARDRRK